MTTVLVLAAVHVKRLPRHAVDASRCGGGKHRGRETPAGEVLCRKAETVIDDVARDAEDGLIGSTSGRFFG
jgi:hypothetical protein